MRKKIIAANWKMNGSTDQISRLIVQIKQQLPEKLSVDCILFPPAIYIPLVQQLLADTALQVGAQNAYPGNSGAFTGEISCAMLRDFGCKYVLTGHSERRNLFAEDDQLVQEKFYNVKENGMIPIFCIGETLEEREKGLTDITIARQLNSLLSRDPDCLNNAVIAYEPIWAIGTGIGASPEQVQTTLFSIRKMIAFFNEDLAEQTPILYGGSLNEKNARALFALPDVDGGLIGNASLDAHKFVEIIECIN